MVVKSMAMSVLVCVCLLSVWVVQVNEVHCTCSAVVMAIEVSGFSGHMCETTYYLYNMMNAHVTAAMIRKRCHDGRVSTHDAQGTRVKKSVTAGC
jgi:hypothetical protein